MEIDNLQLVFSKISVTCYNQALVVSISHVKETLDISLIFVESLFPNCSIFFYLT